MRTVKIRGTEIQSSEFAFGTASLHRVGDRSARLGLLSHAVASGFTHFDTAPLYGYGQTERDLAKILSAHPRLTVTTKVGLLPPGGTRQPRSSVLARKAIGKVIPGLSRALVVENVAAAETSLVGALMRLGRATTDILLVHDPLVGVHTTDEWLSWLEGVRDRGLARAIGVAAEPAALADLRPYGDGLGTVIQTRPAPMPNSEDPARNAGLLFGAMGVLLAGGQISRHAIAPDQVVIVSSLNREHISAFANVGRNDY